jgi:hypothetical protein
MKKLRNNAERKLYLQQAVPDRRQALAAEEKRYRELIARTGHYYARWKRTGAPGWEYILVKFKLTDDVTIGYAWKYE